MHSNLFTNLLTLVPVLGNLALGYKVQTPPLDTDWTYSVGTDPWPEYPRPQLQRSDWQSLNGIWKWKQGAYRGEVVPADDSFQQDILVPSCIESALSGVMQQNQTYSWYSTEFDVPHGFAQKGRRVLLNFEAVDHEATVYVNGDMVGTHRGGYWHFNFDITKYLTPHGTNTLHVFVFDPTDHEGYMNPVGKQARNPSHIFYTPCTGIWQSVWLESVPETYINQLDIIADMSGQVNVTVGTAYASSDQVTVSVIDSKGKEVASAKGVANQPFDFVVDSPSLWSPDSPTLYNITVKLGQDTVNSYTGFRTFSIGEIDGVKRPLINGEFIFQFGTLDQGFWPDGIYTPPNREAMVYDLQVLKDLGLNMLRKHIKVENALFYRACDELGLLLIQDMPSMPLRTPDAEEQADWERQLDILIQQHKNYPSIYTWVIYNEGWGQITDYYPEFNLTDRVKALDPTRFVDATTGWHDHGAGDWHDNHHYANPQCGTPFSSIESTPYDHQRIAIQGEFGGIGHNVSEEHLWKVEAAVSSINQTYEIDLDLDAYNYRGHLLLSELRDQIEKYACSAAVWTQTTDVEGEVNGFLTYDRRILRLDKKQWQADIQALYDAAAARGGKASKKRMVL
ncbi:glycoside hydrolase family 2 protein [Daldinia loculata]|uniref:glycoside hydrolase family 2 protein n=1 Tax=Daldinia loculata TaxID=103429 RepID=UPI0020C2DF6F|nr:glycoside hydrolase family 2 protein [Daldinia loculata]KAI1641762.1 glycoside hydrolase family 2 protein [Daldinia loculata]